MSDQNSYMNETVRPKIVMDSLKELITLELYQVEGVTISNSWFSLNDEHIDFIVDKDDLIIKKDIDVNFNNIVEYEDPINPSGHETLILDKNEILEMKIAAGEGKKMLSF